MTLKQLYPLALLCALSAGFAVTSAMETPKDSTIVMASKMAANATKSAFGWLGSFGTFNLGNIITIDSTKGSSLLLSGLTSCCGWMMQNKALTLCAGMYAMYRFNMNRIANDKLKEQIAALLKACHEPKPANDIDMKSWRERIFTLLAPLKSEANLSAPAWIVSLRWATPLLGRLNFLSSAATNLSALEEYKTADNINDEAINKIITMFTRPGL